MEHLLHYIWKHRIFPLHPLCSTDGRAIEVIHPGLHNHDAGPDFFNSKVKIDGELWVGNVEIHTRASDWFRHHHNTDPAYDNVILHVVEDADMDIPYPTSSRGMIPQLQLPIPSKIQTRYDELVKSDQLPRCRDIISQQPSLIIHNWLSALQVERLGQQTQQIMQRREKCTMDWEKTCFITIARNFGFGINGDALEAWAHSIPSNAIAKHRDNLFQIEAIFFGQAGLLNPEDNNPAIKSSKNTFAVVQNDGDNDYFTRLRQEYKFLQQKFTISSINPTLFRFARLRPQNFPHIRITQLAMLYFEQRLNFSNILNAESIEDFYQLFDTHVSSFWQTHFTFTSQESAPANRKLSNSSKDLLIINSIVPLLFAYGKYKGNEQLCERGMTLLSQIRPENNNVTRAWQEAGIDCESAADSQALIQLTRNYCETNGCLRCRFGHEFIRKNPNFLNEKEQDPPLIKH